MYSIYSRNTCVFSLPDTDLDSSLQGAEKQQTRDWHINNPSTPWQRPRTYITPVHHAHLDGRMLRGCVTEDCSSASSMIWARSIPWQKWLENQFRVFWFGKESGWKILEDIPNEEKQDDETEAWRGWVPCPSFCKSGAILKLKGFFFTSLKKGKMVQEKKPKARRQTWAPGRIIPRPWYLIKQ